MKKHDEGYVLVYVTVVLLVFCLVATTILTGALRNLQHQQDSIAQMEEQYIAAGEIEKIIAALDNFEKKAEAQVVVCGEAVTVSWDDTKDKQTQVPANILTITARSGSVEVTCELKLNCTEVKITKTEADLAANTTEQTTTTIYGWVGYEIVSYRSGTVPADTGEVLK